jgi:phenylalanyl-tRNA synthetase beta chain
MQIGYNWLLEYLPQPISIDDVSNILTKIGLEVEAIEIVEAIKGGLEGLVIGQVLTCEAHPDADKLKITTVDVGNNTLLPIVCGAPNVAAGQKVVVATVGTTVHPTTGEAFKIKKAKIRGSASEGMICAEDEIGLGQSHDGIMILDADALVGQSAKAYFNIPDNDFTIHIGLTPNRSDGNSHLGVAKDICAYQSHHLGQPWQVNIPSPAGPNVSSNALPYTITIEAQDACPRYAGLSIQGVKVAPSPDWLIQRLQSIGVRSINNIVDISNFVLHEFGQPLHIFDYDTISQHTIKVKYATAGTSFTTLDDKERILRDQDLMIADSHDNMCMAGIYGGNRTGVTNGTVNIFIESAYFDPKTIRRASMHHGLRTDAATHFEKGVDIEMVIPALQRAAQLILDCAGGTLASTVTDIYPSPLAATNIKVNFNYINSICGKLYTPTAVKTILSALGFTIINEDENGISLIVPSNKPDVKQAADIAEEILRIDGLDNVQIPTRLNISLSRKKAPLERTYKNKIAQYLTGIGCNEIVTNSITNSKYYPNREDLVHMINNLSSELDVMRPEMVYSGLEVISYNLNRKANDLKLYEMGNIYRKEGDANYQQSSKAAIWLTGNSQNQHWQQTAKKADIYELKGIVANLLKQCGINKVQETVSEQSLIWKRGKNIIATAYSIPMDSLKAFDIKQAVYYAEIDIKEFTQAASSTVIKYSELPKYPSMRRDLALVLDKKVTYEQVATIVQKQKWAALKSYDLFDVFESEKLGHDKKSLALSFTFQLNERTLTDEEVDGMMKTLIVTYQKDLEATIRE